MRKSDHLAAGAGLGALADALQVLRPAAAPFIVGFTGAVSAGKSTLVAALAARMTGEPAAPTVEILSTDGFLLTNAVLDGRGLTLRKGFPESFDVAALRSALAAARLGAVSVPGYSHATYDVDPALTRRIERPDLLLVEGLGLGAVRPALDALVYVDAQEAILQSWFVARFLGLWETAGKDPGSFYARFAGLDREGATTFALSVWRDINLVNLRQNIAPLRAVADVVVTKGADHAILAVTRRPTAG